jgi:predicted nucleotidyltransferase
MRTILSNNIDELKGICQEHQVKSLHVFGSVCTEDFTDESDIDFIISFHKRFFDGYVDNYLSLEKELIKLFDRPIDLITEDTIQNPYFEKIVNKTKTVIYE